MLSPSTLLLVAVLALPAPRTSPTPGPAPAKGPTLSPAETSQARKVLAAAVEKREAAQPKPAVPKGGKPPGFQAHRCVIIHDAEVSAKERASNGPFRVSCSDWVARATNELAVKDAEKPCTTTQYGPGLSGCTTWVAQWDAGRGKWSEAWKKSSP